MNKVKRSAGLGNTGLVATGQTRSVFSNTHPLQVLFVRHARAQEWDDFQGPDDLLRPLTSQGRKEARAAFKLLARLYAPPGCIMSSEAVRAKETAHLLARAFGLKKVLVAPWLNPGCRRHQFNRALAAIPAGLQRVALVGHDPDFSLIVSSLVADGRLRLAFKKGACAEVRMEAGKGELRALIPPLARKAGRKG